MISVPRSFFEERVSQSFGFFLCQAFLKELLDCLILILCCIPLKEQCIGAFLGVYVGNSAEVFV